LRGGVRDFEGGPPLKQKPGSRPQKKHVGEGSLTGRGNLRRLAILSGVKKEWAKKEGW